MFVTFPRPDIMTSMDTICKNKSTPRIIDQTASRPVRHCSNLDNCVGNENENIGKKGLIYVTSEVKFSFNINYHCE